MTRLYLAIAITALLAACTLAATAGRPATVTTCADVATHVNAIYESGQRGDLALSPDSIDAIRWLETQLCPTGDTP